MKHPIVSTVCYLTAPCGGPTLVTDQTMAGDDDSPTTTTTTTTTTTSQSTGSGAAQGWLCAPRRNRMLVFDGTLLHCVLPGIGPAPPASSAPPHSESESASKRRKPSRKKRKRGIGNGEGGGGGGDDDDDDDDTEEKQTKEQEQEPCRLTFMVAFWREDPRAPPFPRQQHLPASPSAASLPSSFSPRQLRWPSSFRDDESGNDEGEEEQEEDGEAWLNERALVKVPRVWEPLTVPPSSSSSSSSSPSSDRQDLLNSCCFTDFAALTSGLLVGSSAKGGCSLNCGGKCPQCLKGAAAAD